MRTTKIVKRLALYQGGPFGAYVETTITVSVVGAGIHVRHPSHAALTLRVERAIDAAANAAVQQPLTDDDIVGTP